MCYYKWATIQEKAAYGTFFDFLLVAFSASINFSEQPSERFYKKYWILTKLWPFMYTQYDRLNQTQIATSWRQSWRRFKTNRLWKARYSNLISKLFIRYTSNCNMLQNSSISIYFLVKPLNIIEKSEQKSAKTLKIWYFCRFLLKFGCHWQPCLHICDVYFE